MNFDIINQLATLLPKNSRMPSNPIIHHLAYCDHSLKLLSTAVDTCNHIAFLVIQPEQLQLLTPSLFYAVHCVIVKGSGVILSSNCSPKTEEMLDQLVKWAPFKKDNELMEFYQR
jgi:hypothetical protein